MKKSLLCVGVPIVFWIGLYVVMSFFIARDQKITHTNAVSVTRSITNGVIINKTNTNETGARH